MYKNGGLCGGQRLYQNGMNYQLGEVVCGTTNNFSGKLSDPLWSALARPPSRACPEKNIEKENLATRRVGIFRPLTKTNKGEMSVHVSQFRFGVDV